MSNLIDRAKDILLKPKETWLAIASESTAPKDLILTYALPLVAIGPVASFIGGQLFGYSALFVTIRPGLFDGLMSAIFTFVMSLVSVVILSLIVDFLAPKFEGKSHQPSAFKLSVYSMTAGWIGGIFGLVPSLSLVGFLAAVYGVYLFYLGCEPLMKVPQKKSAVFTAVVIICAIVLGVVSVSIVSTVSSGFHWGMTPTLSTGKGTDININVPAAGSIDLSGLENAAQQAEAVANGDAQPVEATALQALLPDSIGHFQRTSLESTALSTVGSQAAATYATDDENFRLEVSDMTGVGFLAALGASMGVQQNREDANGYERSQTVGGEWQVEKWDRVNHFGSMEVTVAQRFMIKAEGSVKNIKTLKGAIAEVDKDDLLSLLK